ncbi:P-type conjugative transfer protein TrbG [Salmonella enterica]|uniref:P-type conjugative transfer protein TrbG n=1 Tax=Escherichia coli TaxID=562 RepID=UPI0017EEBC5E|nr:P-type conjugative transfer protein TrbG [Escherichia coli]EIC0560684.1 P-type conjugative transfer protein TrbG [Salmonella enterica subsp. enterica serovar Heidelberg]EJS7522881.1 P-type conjugative transfer protein TrbG [Salmonella enterica]WNE02611.1 P-type conjugative transfer protein TrbG [Escherichia coli]HAJ6717880.1 P-type conjugative transfer protein TrbG [Escherichia coli]
MKKTQWMAGLAVAALAVPVFAQDVPALAASPQGEALPPIPMFAPDSVQLDAKEAEGVRLANKWKTHPDRPRQGEDGSVKYLFGATQPTLVCAPLDTCNIILQGGEIVNGVHVGDKPRWKITPDTMGAGDNAATVLVVKPVDVGLTTTLTVTTDRRLYSIKLVSKARGSMPNLSFDYPDDMDRAWAAYREQRAKQTYSNTMPGSGGQSLASLDFGFRLGGDSPSWKPVRVYTDGSKTYIQFPSANFGGEAPALVAKGNGGWFSKAPEKLINYRPIGDRYVVDRVIDKASLIVGVGGDQTEVTITRTGGK